MAFNFNGNTPKNILYNGLNVAKLIYNNVVVWAKRIISGIPPLTLNNSLGEDLINYKVYGNSIQDGTPTTSDPIEIKSVGDYASPSGLPDGYEELEYIESTGTQYIDTGVVPTATSKASITFWSNKDAGTSYQVLISSLQSANNNNTRFNLAIGQTNTPYFSLGSENGTSNFYIEVPNNTYVNQKLTYSIDAKTKIGTCEEYNATSTVNYTPPQANIKLLVYSYYNYSATDGLASGKLYKYEYSDGIYSQNLIPCKSTTTVTNVDGISCPSGTIGLYDLVNNEFYTNKGTGTFVAGPSAMKYKIPITVNGKNIINKNDFEKGTINAQGANQSNDNQTRAKNLIKVDSNTTYSVSANTAGIYRIHYYKNDLSYIGSELISTDNSFTTANNCGYIRFNKGTSLENMMNIEFQIEKGSTVTSYEPYYAPTTTNIYLDEPIRKLGNADLVKLPDGYTQLEYIESTGEQYIDTGYILNQDSAIELDATIVGENRKAVCGSRSSATSNNFSIFMGDRGSGNQIGADFYNYNDNRFYYTFTENERIKIYVSKEKVLFNSTQYNISSYSDFETPGNCYVFSYYNKLDSYFNTSMKCYGFKIWQGGTLKRNFIPCKCTATVTNVDGTPCPSGTIGLYDLVNNEFYTNKGTGIFTAGNEIYADYIDYETQKVYRNVIVNDDSGEQTIENSYSGTTDTTGTSVELPTISTNEGTNIIEIDTEITPSNIEVKYYAKGVV